MFCVKCGENLQDQTKFCTKCGAMTSNSGYPNQSLSQGQPYNQGQPNNQSQPYNQGQPNNQSQPYNQGQPYNQSQPYNQGQPFSQAAPGGPAFGFSPRIKDPAFARYLKNSNRWAGIFAIILAVIAVVGFFIAGQSGAGDMENPQALFIGMAIGGMFLLIAFFQIMHKKKDRTWDGQVVDKKVEKKTRSRETSDDSYTTEHYTLFTVLIQENNGKFHPLAIENDTRYFDYFQIGDRVRHHAGFAVYERQDKIRDSYIFCIACGTKNDIYLDACHRCKCPLLK